MAGIMVSRATWLFAGVLAAMSIVGPAAAEDIFIAQVAVGSDNGTSCDNAHAAAWFNTSSNWGLGEGRISPGDTAHLCGTITDSLVIQGSGTDTGRITISFETDAKIAAPDFPGTYSGSGGAIFGNGKHFIIIDGGGNGIIECTDNGSPGFFGHSSTSQGVHAIHCNDWEIKNLTIRNIYQAKLNEKETNAGGITLFDVNRMNVHHNRIDYVRSGVVVGLYNDTDIEIHNNEISRIAAGAFIGIGAPGYTGDNVRIHHNRIYDTTPWGYNDGIKLFGVPNTRDPFTNIKVHNNVIGPDISTPTHPATAHILVDTGWYSGVEIYNNILLAGTNDNLANAFITVGGCHPVYGLGVCPMNAKIYNNTMISEYVGLEIAILVGKASSGHEIFNNIFKFKGSFMAYYINDAETTVTYCDNNLYYSENLVKFPDNRSFEQQKVLGMDLQSSLGDPQFVDQGNPSGSDSLFFTGDDGLRPLNPAAIGGRNVGDFKGALPVGFPGAPKNLRLR